MRPLIAILLLLTAGSGWSQTNDPRAELRAARERLDAAARELAELHRKYGPPPGFDVRLPAPVRLGMVLGRPREEGIELVAVTPSGPAAEAGLLAGDVVTRLNGRALAGRDLAALHQAHLEIEALGSGDYVSVEYQRDGQDYSAELEVRSDEAPYRAGGPFTVATAGAGPRSGVQAFGAVGFGRPMGVMLHDLNPGLGRYFGVDAGVLVLTGGDDRLGLMPGDVITEVDSSPVAGQAQLFEALGSVKRPVTVIRDGGTLVLSLGQQELLGGMPQFLGAPPGDTLHFIELHDEAAEPPE